MTYRARSWRPVAALLVSAAAAAIADTDQETGLVKAPGWKQVKTHCTACHSARLIVQQRGDKDQWLKIIRWMQRTQNLWVIPPGDESAILAYLASSYPPGATFRRQGLATHLLPPAPRSE